MQHNNSEKQNSALPQENNKQEDSATRALESSSAKDNSDSVDRHNKTDNPEDQAERSYQQRAAIYHAKAVSVRKLEYASREFEEILRIIHSTNWKNQAQIKKNIYEIELICKNAILEIKGV